MGGGGGGGERVVRRGGVKGATRESEGGRERWGRWGWGVGGGGGRVHVLFIASDVREEKSVALTAAPTPIISRQWGYSGRRNWSNSSLRSRKRAGCVCDACGQ